jgi:hypothetical protein
MTDSPLPSTISQCDFPHVTEGVSGVPSELTSALPLGLCSGGSPPDHSTSGGVPIGTIRGVMLDPAKGGVWDAPTLILAEQLRFRHPQDGSRAGQIRGGAVAGSRHPPDASNGADRLLLL